MSILLPKYFPDVLLRIEFWAVARKTVEFHLITRILNEIRHRFTLMVRRAINNQDQIAVGRATKRHQEGAESLLREVTQLHPIAKQPGTRDRAKSLDSSVAAESLVLWRAPDTAPSSTARALRGQRHFVFKKNGSRLPDSGPLNLPFGFGLPPILLGRISQRQQSLWLLHAEAARPEQLRHVVRMIDDAEMGTDNSRHPPRIPQVIREAGGCGPGINQVVEQQEFFFQQFGRASRMWSGQQAFISLTLEVANPVGNAAAGDAQTSGHFSVTVLARDHDQPSYPKDDITSSERFSLRRKFFQIAQLARTQGQCFTRTPHRYPPFFNEDTWIGEFA